MGGVTIKGAAQYLSYQPREKKQQDRSKGVNEEKYFKNILKQSPKLEKAKALKQQRERLVADFKQKYKNNSSAFLGD